MVCAEPVVADTHNTVAAVLHPHSLDSRNQAGKHCREVTLAIHITALLAGGLHTCMNGVR